MQLPVSVLQYSKGFEYFAVRFAYSYDRPDLFTGKNKEKMCEFFHMYQSIQYNEDILEILLEDRRDRRKENDVFRAGLFEAKKLADMLLFLRGNTPEVSLFMAVSFVDMLSLCGDMCLIRCSKSPGDIMRMLDRQLNIRVRENTSLGEVLRKWRDFTGRSFQPQKETITDFEISMNMAYILFQNIICDLLTAGFSYSHSLPNSPKVCSSMLSDIEEHREEKMSERVR